MLGRRPVGVDDRRTVVEQPRFDSRWHPPVTFSRRHASVILELTFLEPAARPSDPTSRERRRQATEPSN